MTVAIKFMQPGETDLWDAYVNNHPYGSAYHYSAWGKVIYQTYGHQIFNLVAKDPDGALVGILPLVHINHFLFGNNLFSLPFVDLGGILADSADVEQALLYRATEIAHEHNIPSVEFRQTYFLTGAGKTSAAGFQWNKNSSQQAEKVRMLLELPDSSEELMASFRSKLRSQIRRPLKDGLTTRVGGAELLDDFYTVFAENMRDLGSPVHSKKFLRNLQSELSENTRIFIVYQGNTPLACSFTLRHKNCLANPWASSLHKYSRLSPNMLLYWTMLEYACDNGLATFDFGRSTPGGGSYKFKEQWGATEQPLYWQVFTTQQHISDCLTVHKSKFELAMFVWKRLPVSVSKLIGPVIRKNIGL